MPKNAPQQMANRFRKLAVKRPDGYPKTQSEQPITVTQN